MIIYIDYLYNKDVDSMQFQIEHNGEKYDFFTYKENTVLCEEGRSISKKRLERKLGSISLNDLLEYIVCVIVAIK